MEPYEIALKRWGLKQLEAKYPEDKFTVETIAVELGTYTESSGYCETCYYEDTNAQVEISTKSDQGYRRIELQDVTLDEIIKGLFEVAEG